MAQRIFVLTLAAFASLLAARLFAADDASLGKDLKATIVLQGMPCDQLIGSKRNADSDYTASCGTIDITILCERAGTSDRAEALGPVWRTPYRNAMPIEPTVA